MIVWTAAYRVEITETGWGLESFTLIEWMLMISHLGMAIEAILYYKLYRFGVIHLSAVGAWTFLNDYIDYGLDMHPWVHDAVDRLTTEMAIITVLLSVLSLLLFYILKVKTKEKTS